VKESEGDYKEIQAEMPSTDTRYKTQMQPISWMEGSILI